MTAPTIAEYLKFANVQMSAEALFGFSALPTSANLTPGNAYDGLIDPQVLIDGNRHASKFTTTQAADFASQWTVVEHKSNTKTGFSGTLLKAIKDDPATGTKAGEYVISFRSTEFLDDAARDNQATNTLEIKEKGWAFGQIDDMETWYAHLIGVPYGAKLIPDGAKFSVTGYSLGGHLATAFNLLRAEDGTQSRIDKVVTFNGAGVGTVLQGTLGSVMNTFHQLRLNTDQIDDAISDPELRTLVGSIRTGLANNTMTIFQAQVALVALYPNGETAAQTKEKSLVNTALTRMQTVITEATDAPLLKNATDLVAAYAHQTSAKGRFGCEARRLQTPRTQATHAHAERATHKTPHARSMRLTGPKRPGRRMERAGSTS